MTLSEILQKEREAKRLTVEDVNQKTNVPLKYIVALEEADFSNLPAPVYTRGYLKKISQLLNLNEEELWNLFLKERSASKAPTIDTLPQNRFAQPLKWHYVVLKILKSLPVIIITVTVAGFLFIQVKSFWGAPYLKLDNPAIDLATQDESIKVEGLGRPNSYITLNGKEIYLGKDGKFSEEIYLNPGKNEITVAAKSRLGKTTTITKFVVKE
ncbi:MAG TPA: helix-turn-helix domain-containing protein [Candidatus Paceibacterota bacterium]|nr:helix-turn-helix domain-containing protein [Candidatus Paceibacterota bacterium]